MAKRYTVTLDDNQIEFLKKLAKHDNISVHMEIQSLLDLQISETKDAMQEFWQDDEKG